MIKSPLPKQGRHGKEDVVNSLMRKPSVNEEYKEAFRTKSYIEICNKVQDQLEMRSLTSGDLDHDDDEYLHLSEYLLQPPHQETLTSMFDHTSNHHQFLLSYFKISLEATKICESLLTNVHQARNGYRAIKTVTKLIERVPDCGNRTHNHYHRVCKALASFARRGNPFPTTTLVKFLELHDNHVNLLQELTSQHRKTKRRTKFIRLIKRGMTSFVVMACGALIIALLVLAMHIATAGLAAAPGLVIICTLGLFMMKKTRRDERDWNVARLDEVVEQLDMAARGVYIMMNDFDMMSRLVRRLHDEMEHRKFVAEICVRKGKNEMLKEVIEREFQMHERCFLEQLEELEKQICLCFLDINRSRRLLVREMVKWY
ncbi:hypothetical protein Sango_2350000 [Sesamum angolense]|uniref:Uncharacterized protein n=1 Tax=Sesamum angolense TaxID=2727404 RepID=A0AAE1W6B3_9LAMI|nr:hypothetical protein Sango_2350000 [Sesamum angolense]